MSELGRLALLLCLPIAAFSAMSGLLGLRLGKEKLESTCLLSNLLVAALITISASCMIYSLVSADFSVKYVYLHTDRSMPLVYLISAFWGGQEGSLLFWLWMLSLYGAAAIWIHRSHRLLTPWANAVVMGTVSFFVILLVFEADPFANWIGETPGDGRGLNPMLQNPYMIVHPPTMYLGYIGMTVPFAYGIAAMATGRTDEVWLRLCRRWTLVGWLFLSLGLVLGMIWAYQEMGWGGYWTWDPVENAGLLPWLTCTAYLHSVMIQERRGMFKRWNMSLVILSFAFTIVGTFLTRSGIVQSVHAFAQSDIGHYFVAFLLVSLLFGFGLMWLKTESLSSKSEVESMLSREFAFGLNNWILLGMAFFLLFATLFPSLSDFFLGQTISVGEPFFNEWMVPLGLILLFLTGVGPLIAWRRASRSSLIRQFLGPSVTGILAGIFALGIAYPKSGSLYPILTFALCAFVAATVVQEILRGTLVRMRSSDESPPVALFELISRGKRRYGGYVIHLGIALMFIGFGGRAYNEVEEVSLSQGEIARIGRYQIRHEGLRFEENAHRSEIIADIAVMNAGGRRLGSMEPARWVFRRNEQPTNRVAIRSSLLDDLYLALGSWDAKRGDVALRLAVHPLVIWIWIGSLLLILGTAIALTPDRRASAGSRRRRPNEKSASGSGTDSSVARAPFAHLEDGV